MLHATLKKYIDWVEERKKASDDAWFMKKHFTLELATRAINRYKVNCPGCTGNRWHLGSKTEKTFVTISCLLCGLLFKYDFRILFAHLVSEDQAKKLKEAEVSKSEAPPSTPTEPEAANTAS